MEQMENLKQLDEILSTMRARLLQEERAAAPQRVGEFPLTDIEKALTLIHVELELLHKTIFIKVMANGVEI